MQTSRTDGRLNSDNNKLPLPASFFLVLQGRHLWMVSDFNGRLWLKKDMVTQNFALRSILKKHLCCFSQVFLRLIDSFPLVCDSQFLATGNIPVIFRLDYAFEIRSLVSSPCNRTDSLLNILGNISVCDASQLHAVTL